MTQCCGQGRQLRTASSTLLQAPGYLHAVQAGLHHAVLHTASHGCRLLRESSPTTETTSKDVHRAKGGGNGEGAAKRKEGLQEGRGETAERGWAHKDVWHCQPRHCSLANSASSIAESMAGVQMSHYSLLRAASGHTLARGNHGCLHSACWSAAQKLAEVMLWLSQGLPHFCLQNEDLCCRTSAFCRKFYGFTHQLLGLMRLTPDLVSRGRKNSRQCFWQCSSSRGSSGRADTTRNTESSSSISTTSWDGLCLSYCFEQHDPVGHPRTLSPNSSFAIPASPEDGFCQEDSGLRWSTLSSLLGESCSPLCQSCSMCTDDQICLPREFNVSILGSDELW